jgi:bacterioferritin
MPKKPQITPVITALNDVLTGELTAINQYFLHAEICGHWGYERLYKRIRADSIDEMKHAEQVMERILYLEGLPNMQRLSKVNVGWTVKEMFTADMALEREAVTRLVDAIKTAEAEKDVGSRLLFEKILASEEEHIDWLDAQLELIEQVGEQNYLAMQINGGG